MKEYFAAGLLKRPASLGDATRTAGILVLVAASLLSAAPAHAAAPVPLGRAASAPAELAVTFEQAAVVASDLSPGGDAVFFSVAREPQGYYNRIVRRSGFELVDALGEARFAVERAAVPLKSVWVVADVATGAFSVAAPESFALREVPFPSRGFEVGAPGLVNRLRHTMPYVDLVLIRPGVGAWRLQSFDGAATDRSDEGDGEVVTSLEDLAGIDELATPAPTRFAQDDVLVVIDPRTLRYYGTRLLGPPQARGAAP